MNKITKWLLLAVMLGQSLVFAGPLHEAVHAGNLEEVKRLLAIGTAVDAVDEENISEGTALAKAVFKLKPEIVKELLNHGANINVEDGFGRPIPLDSTSQEIIKIIREWSIENQIKATNPENIKILDGNVQGSYANDFADYGAVLAKRREARKAEVERVTAIPKGPASIIHEYMGDD